MNARYIIARLITRDSHDANDILAALAADGWRVVRLEEVNVRTVGTTCDDDVVIEVLGGDVGLHTSDVSLYRITEEATPLVTKTGKVLTDEDIEALADEADRGYEVNRD